MDAAVTAGSERLDLAGRHIVLGLSGGIACYKAADLLRELVKAGATVQPVMTEAAGHFSVYALARYTPATTGQKDSLLSRRLRVAGIPGCLPRAGSRCLAP